MSISDAIYELLSGDMTVTEVATQGIYPSGQPKQNTIPNFLTHEIIGSDRPGTVRVPCRATRYTIRVAGVCKTEPELRRLMDAVELRLDGYKGGDVLGCMVQDKTTDPDATDPTTHRESHTYDVWYARRQFGGND